MKDTNSKHPGARGNQTTNPAKHLPPTASFHQQHHQKTTKPTLVGVGAPYQRPLPSDTETAAAQQRTQTTAASTTTRIQISVPTSNRGRKKPTPAALTAPRQQQQATNSISASSTAAAATHDVTPVANATAATKKISTDAGATAASSNKTKTAAKAVASKSTTKTVPSMTANANNNANTATEAATATATTSNQTVKKKKHKKHKQKFAHDWPASSAESLPPLSSSLVQRLQEHNLNFPTNDECTSLKITPSGRLLIACFTDGTLRLFDMTGTFTKRRINDSAGDDSVEGLFDMDSSASSSSEEEESTCSSSANNQSSTLMESYANTPVKLKKGSRSQMVCSKAYQKYGAVAAQCYAKGVHSTLLMDLDIAEDGQYCFAGAARGTMELIAVKLETLESYFDKYLAGTDMQHPPAQVDILDLVSVYRRSDAKLRGFGACTRLRNSTNSNPKYLLFTGKGIKNIHIWKFEPPVDPNAGENDAKFTALYDTNTNGTSITHLQFRYDSSGLLQAISKSDGQRLRIWDMSYEQHATNPKNPFFSKRSVIKKLAAQQEKQSPGSARPKRPPFVDVMHSETTLGIAGGFAFCDGGSAVFNNISLVSLDVPNVESPFNHTELALPGGVGDAARPSRRQQRGDLKSITAVAGSVMDAGQVLMEISDGALVRYVSEYHQPKVEPIVIPGLDAMPPQEGFSRKLCLARVGNVGIFIGGVASYNSNTGRGQISLRPLNEGVLNSELPLAKGFWGFAPSLRSDPKKTLQKAKAAASSSEEGKQNHTGTTITVKQQPTKKVNAAPTCDSPLHEPDISNWTNPPASAIAERVSKEVATPSHEQPMNIQLFATASTSKKDIVDPIGKKKKRIKTMDLNTAATPQDRVGKTVSVIPQTLLQPKKQVVNSTPGPTITTNAPQERSSSVQPSKQYRRPSLSSSEKSDKAPSNLSATTPKSTDTQSIAVPVPATPQLRTAEEHLAAARAKSQTFVAAISSGAQVSPESRPGTSTKVASKKKNEIDIRVYLATASMKNAKESHPKEKRDAPIAAKPAQSALKEMPQPSFPSPPVPRKRATTEEEIRDIATTLCDMGSAGKPVKAAAKRPYSEIGTSTPSTPEEVEDVTPRRKVAKRPPLSSAYKKNHVVASDRFFQECNLQQQRLETILENQIPKKNVNERMGISSDLTARTGDLAKDQEMARMRMAAQHRASHEQLLKRVINAAAAAVRAMKRCTTIQGVVDAKETWQKSFQEYVEMLDDIVWRQTQDAETLAQQQTLEGKGRRAPQLQVGFPFYTSFDNCIEAVETIINVVKNN